MSENVRLKGGICKPSSDIPLNWGDMRSVFGYNLYSSQILPIEYFYFML